jgi:hypothetical protein
VLRPVLAALAASLALAPAAEAAAGPPSTYLSGRTFACWQTFASYGPNGQLGGFNRAARGRITFATDFVPGYMVSGETMTVYLPKAAGTTGAWQPTATGVRFTSGPFHVPARGWDLVADVHRRGVTMPHDKRKGTRYQLVIRSAATARKVADDAPPKGTGRNFIITPWYCENRS